MRFSAFVCILLLLTSCDSTATDEVPNPDEEQPIVDRELLRARFTGTTTGRWIEAGGRSFTFQTLFAEVYIRELPDSLKSENSYFEADAAVYYWIDLFAGGQEYRHAASLFCGVEVGSLSNNGLEFNAVNVLDEDADSVITGIEDFRKYYSITLPVIEDEALTDSLISMMWLELPHLVTWVSTGEEPTLTPESVSEIIPTYSVGADRAMRVEHAEYESNPCDRVLSR